MRTKRAVSLTDKCKYWRCAGRALWRGHPVCETDKRRHWRGTVSLEAALVFPVVIVMILVFIFAVQTVQDTVVIGHALDQTAKEIALLLPLADVFENVADPHDWLRRYFPDEKMAELALGGAADIASTVLASPFILKRVRYWMHHTAAGQKLAPPSGEMKLAIDFDLDRRSCWLVLSYRKTVPEGIPWQIVRSCIPIWNAGLFKKEEPGHGDNEKDNLWMLSNFERGAAVRTLFGGHLPPFYPVIAAWNGSEAVSIKSMDITAPTYGDGHGGAAEKRLTQYLEALASFQGAGGEGPAPGEMRSRRLILVVPDNAVPWKTSGTYAAWRALAKSYGVTLDLREYGTSHAHNG